MKRLIQRILEILAWLTSSAATSAKQDIGNASLDSIDGKLSGIAANQEARTDFPDSEGHSKLDTLAIALQALLLELQEKLEAGQSVALDAATLAALENITATISGAVALDAATLAALESITVQNFPADYPDADVLAKVEEVRSVLADILARLDDPLGVWGPLTDVQLRASAVVVRDEAKNEWTATSDGSPLTTTTAVSMRTAVASKRIYIASLQLSNDDTTKTGIRIRDGSGGTVLWQFGVGATASGLTPLQVPSEPIVFAIPLRTTAGNAPYIECTVSGATLDWNAQGWIES